VKRYQSVYTRPIKLLLMSFSIASLATSLGDLEYICVYF